MIARVVVLYIAGSGIVVYPFNMFLSSPFLSFHVLLLPRHVFSPVASPKANGMSFRPSSTWEVLAELVLCTSPSTSDSACSSAENRRRFDASFEVANDVEENHAASGGDVGWVGEGGMLQKRKGVSANGGSSTERFHAHRFVVALRSGTMRAMLQSGEFSPYGIGCCCHVGMLVCLL